MRMIRLISQLVFAFSLAVSPIWVSGEEPSTAALEVLDRFMTAFNARDSEAWATYPTLSPRALCQPNRQGL